MAEKHRGGMKVTDEQADIIDHVVGQQLTVVDAGAGSGKTYTTVATVLQLLDTHPDASIERFVLITFTRKAADELKQRIEKALLERRANAIIPVEIHRWVQAKERLGNAYIGTIHGFCRRLLRAFGHGSLVARESDVKLSGAGLLYESICDTFEEQIDLDPNHPLLGEMGQVYQSYHLESLVKEIYDDIRNRGLNCADVVERTKQQPDDAGKAIRIATAELVRRVHQVYTEQKLEEQQIDAADLLAKTAEVLDRARDDEPAILRKIAARYRWLFVDEFQDTDRVQERIIESLLPELEGVLLVGDVKQSIYRFRGAGQELSAIAQRHRVPVLPLSISRRPTMQLLKLQNELFKSVGARYPALHNPLQFPETPIQATSDLPSMGYVEQGKDESMLTGALATASSILRLVKRAPSIDVKSGVVRPLVAGDIAILFRTNRALDEYERLLSKHLAGQVQVRREEGGQFFQRPEIIAAYRLLRLILDYPNEIVIAQALNTPYLRHVDSGVAEQRLMQFGRMHQSQLASWFVNAHPVLGGEMRRLQASIRTATVPELLENLYRSFALREHHLRRGDRRSVDNLERLREMARTLADSEQLLTARVFIRWLQDRLLSGFDEPEAGDPEKADDADESDEPLRPSYVRLMTVHKAKGLEFPVVVLPEVHSAVVNSSGDDRVRFVVGEQFGLDLNLQVGGGSPRSADFQKRTRSDDDGQREEAMRLFYVAVTRARNCTIFVGSSDLTKSRPTNHRRYSWKDEIAAAWNRMEALGARRRANP